MSLWIANERIIKNLMDLLEEPYFKGLILPGKLQKLIVKFWC
jgi:hypothetical protein